MYSVHTACMRIISPRSLIYDNLLILVIKLESLTTTTDEEEEVNKLFLAFDDG